LNGFPGELVRRTLLFLLGQHKDPKRGDFGGFFDHNPAQQIHAGLRKRDFLGGSGVIQPQLLFR
jgi:hypothetical protein